ncbi:hypothetical protein B0H16DRAFT_1450116 [Mycena metata]|uniref:Uncharacterized protein n=1 Tax=Mycena metata TaxID=1033252 RepID=A0AAD7NUE2_9AGAR|nr:hypothetical protein B0H16DRAFT_1450116 [Mycena metata]
MTNVREMQDQAQLRHQEILKMTERYFNDSDLEARFHCDLGFYYFHRNYDLSTALQYGQIALSLAQSRGNLRRQCDAPNTLGELKTLAGDYAAGQAYVHEVQRPAKTCGDFGREARGLYNEAICLMSLGEYQECLALTTRGREILGLGGLSHGRLSYLLMEVQAGAHQFKSEYFQAHNIQNQILQRTTNDNNQQAFSLMTIAEIEIPMGVSRIEIQKKIEAAQVIFRASGYAMFSIACDTIQADLNLREGDLSCPLFCKCLQLGWGKYSEAVSYCLERLADIDRWEGYHHPTSWTAVFLAHSFKAKQRLEIHKALQFLGDVFLREDDEATAIFLFTLALEGFTQMDVHRSRAECMIRLGDISKHGDLLTALELWETARPLFEHSSQAKHVQNIDERLAGIDENVKEQHRRRLAQIVKLNTPTTKVEEIEEDLSENKLEEEVGLIAA